MFRDVSNRKPLAIKRQTDYNQFVSYEGEKPFRNPNRDPYFKYYRRERLLLKTLADCYYNPMVFHRKAMKQYRYVMIVILPFLYHRLWKPPDREIIELLRDEISLCHEVSRHYRRHFGSIFRNAGLD